MRVFGLHLTWRGDCTGVSCDLTHLHGLYHDCAEFPSLSLFTALSLLQGISFRQALFSVTFLSGVGSPPRPAILTAQPACCLIIRASAHELSCKCSADLSCKHFDSFSGYSLIGRRGFWSLSLYAHYLEYLIMKSNNEIQYRKSDKANTSRAEQIRDVLVNSYTAVIFTCPQETHSSVDNSC